MALAAASLLRADYAPEKWNLEARDKFAAQRFGIFIHWGLYANYAQGVWYQQKIGIDTETYGRMIDGFCPSKFDANEWVRVFKDAGAKYVTITSRHHDGFSLWPTKVDDGYNIANTPFKRDILGELSKACDEAGLQLNFYYSLMDWHRKDYPAGTAAVKCLGEQKGDYESYKKFMLGQIGELIDSYHPGNIWFDGEWEHAHHQGDGTWKRTLDWDFDTIYDFIHSKKTLVANNNHQPIRPKEDIQLFERDLPGDNSDGGFSKNQPIAHDRPIEQCDVIQHGVWGYKINERKFRTPEEVCAMICRCAGKDSNLLMNIGPDGSGRLPARAVEVMAEVGKWMRANGEAIYETRGVGLVKNADGSESAKTKKGDVVYVITIPKDAKGFPTVGGPHAAGETSAKTTGRAPAAGRRPLEAEVRPFGEAPALWIDGRPDTGLMHWNRHLSADDVSVFRRAGVHLYSVMGVPEMPSPDGGAVDYGDGFAAVPVMDGRWIDETFAALAKEDPEAKVLVRMRLTTPDWWRRRHPGECVVTVDREGRGFERPWASPASKAWLAECDAAMRRTMRMVEAKWSHMTVGYHPGLAACAENSYDWATGVADFSHVQTNALVCAVPDPRAYFGGFGDVRRFLDVKTEMNAVAFMRRQSEVMGGAAAFLASVVKDELRRLGRKKICGVFYGYAALPVNKTDILCSGHHAHELVLGSPDVDFVAAPIEYAARQAGGASLAQVLPGSLAAHGKLYWAEDDTRYHLASSAGDCVSESADETRWILTRNFLDAFSHGGTVWWMDLFGRGWYRDEAFVGMLSACREFAARHMGRRSSVAQVGVFVTERAFAVERAAPVPISNELVDSELPEIAACGAPYDLFRLEDLDVLARRGGLSRIRLAIVLNAHSADADLRRLARERLCRDGRTVVFLGPAGYIRGGESGAELCEELTGIRMAERNVRDSGVVEAFAGGRRLSFGSSTATRPSLIVADKSALAEGWYVQGSSRSRFGEPRAVAIASKDMGGWTSIVCPVAFLPSDLIRRYAEEAGVHVYSDCGDQVFAGEGWFAVAAKMPGRRRLRAPWSTRSIEADMKRGEVRIVERGLGGR